uniref:Cystinosin homolog n=1 Tax=Meloidogyne enterolobii TaxID=390850 RepID=A0A6V7UQ23_MELEN|nr:unnamed protein product [Meloidogyne enterolobii]
MLSTTQIIFFILFLPCTLLSIKEDSEFIEIENDRHFKDVDAKKLDLEFPEELNLIIGVKEDIQFTYRGHLHSHLELIFDFDHNILNVTPTRLVLNPGNDSTSKLSVVGLSLSSRTFIDLKDCFLTNGTRRIGKCPFNQEDVFVRLVVARSSIISVLVIVTGWIYFSAWSISFYPQIILNWQRKSVIGLNFDFLLLNIIGFFCYTIYNLLLYFDPIVQDIYIARHGNRSLIPVLLNDVIFSGQALFACLITAFQCFIYERGTQRISYTCRIWASILLGFSSLSLLLALFSFFNWLDFINYLSYVKMAVTLSKYFPQAILNFKRKSTIGWSIGNVLLDATGGTMDILQMILQAKNTADWSAFVGNPVKFGLGFVSIIFDVLFIIQHYVLYPHKESDTYDQVSNPVTPVPATLSVVGLNADLEREDDNTQLVVSD